MQRYTPPSLILTHLPLCTATSQVVHAGSAGKHWYIERVAAVSLLALIPAGFVCPNPVVDYGLAVLIPLHGHWSVGSVGSDKLLRVGKLFSLHPRTHTHTHTHTHSHTHTHTHTHSHTQSLDEKANVWGQIRVVGF